MGFLSGLFRARDAPANRTSGSAYSFFLGNSTSGKRVNERTSMQMTAVYSCVRILSEAVAGLPLHFYRYTEGSGKEKAQRALIGKGYSCGNGGADGAFGDGMRDAVMRFQKAHGLKADGIIGKDTCAKLGGKWNA